MNKSSGTSALRQSRQRQRILEILRATEIHPTADWIYDKLKKEIPNLSLGTVYRNLSVLIEQGLVKKIHYGSTFDRFEANVSQHYHLICEKCGKILDFTMPIYENLNSQASQLTDFKIQSHRIEFFGVCTQCSEEKS